MNCWLDPMLWGECAGLAAGNAVAAVASIPDGIAHSFGAAATSAVTWLWQQVSDATTVNLTDPGIRNDIAITAGIAAVITVALFCIQVIGSALRGSASGLGRSVRGLLIAFAGAVFAIAATELTLTAVDALANGIVQAATRHSLDQVGANLVAVSSLGLLGWAGLLLMSLVLLLAVAVIWCAMMIRKMLIVIAAVFAPIAFSGSTADITKGWARRWVEFTVALIFSKLILVVIFLIGLSMVDGAGATGSTSNQITNLAIGTLTLLLAGFAPWLAIRMVHFAGDAFHQVHAQARAAGTGAAMAVAAPQKAAALYGGAKRAIAGSHPAKPASSPGDTAPAAQTADNAASTTGTSQAKPEAAAPTDKPESARVVDGQTNTGQHQKSTSSTRSSRAITRPSSDGGTRPVGTPTAPGSRTTTQTGGATSAAASRQSTASSTKPPASTTATTAEAVTATRTVNRSDTAGDPSAPPQQSVRATTRPARSASPGTRPGRSSEQDGKP